LPQAELARTFDRYYEFFVARREGRRAWRDYTPYELRLVGTFVLLDQPRRAHELLEFFMGDQRPAGWRHWAEVVWRDPRTPGFVGDMPHTWVGSAFMNSLRAMLVHEDGDALRLLAGVSPRWLTEDDGLRIEAFPTWFGTIDLSARVVDDALRVRISGAVRPVGGYGLVVPDRVAHHAGPLRRHGACGPKSRGQHGGITGERARRGRRVAAKVRRAPSAARPEHTGAPIGENTHEHDRQFAG
jgi:hypothetical protein